jgi:hypothetical protein
MTKANAGFKVNRREMVFGITSAAAGFAFLGCEGPDHATGVNEQSALNPPGNDAIRVLSRLDVVTRDTMAGVISMLVPGYDAYSIWQGVSLPEAGGLAARGDEYLTFYLNKYLPVPPLAQVVVNALRPQLKRISLSIPGEILGVISPQLRTTLGNYGSLYGAALQVNNLTLPLAPLIAAILNFLAISVRPSSLLGPFLTPFSRLTYQEKGEVWKRFEVLVPDYFSPGSPTSIVPPGQDPDLLRSLVGLLDYASGVVPALGMFGSYSEWHVFDYATRTIKARPVGYTLSNYGGPVEGWDEFKGYYQGRRSATDA